MNKMYQALIVKFILFITLLACSCLTLENDDEFEQEPKVTRQFKMRCTRRYSPGICANHLVPVWTYVFHEQNCTERLGCGNHFQANRFKTFEICMKQCQRLAEVYLKMLEVQDYQLNNYSDPLRKGEAEKERSNITAIDSEEQEDDPPKAEGEELAYDEYEQGDNETHSIIYKELFDNEDIFPPDVDRIDGEIRSQYDLLHP